MNDSKNGDFNFFHGCKTSDDIRQKYLRMAKQLHPDLGGTTAEFQEMQNQYEKKIDAANTKESSESKAGYDCKWTEYDIDLMNKINEVIHLDGIEIEIMGQWAWISGNTYPVKDSIKAAGFKWSKGKKSWYYATYISSKKKRFSKYNKLDEIRDVFGAARIDSKPRKKMA